MRLPSSSYRRSALPQIAEMCPPARIAPMGRTPKTFPTVFFRHQGGAGWQKTTVGGVFRRPGRRPGLRLPRSRLTGGAQERSQPSFFATRGAACGRKLRLGTFCAIAASTPGCRLRISLPVAARFLFSPPRRRRVAENYGWGRFGDLGASPKLCVMQAAGEAVLDPSGAPRGRRGRVAGSRRRPGMPSCAGTCARQEACARRTCGGNSQAKAI